MNEPPLLDWIRGRLNGPGCTTATRTLADLTGVFADEAARAAMDPATPAYRVEMHTVVPEGEPGGLFFGISILHPGKVGDEYFMTKGHFHARRETAEYYWCTQGQGILLLMDQDRNTRMEELAPGTLHYIPGHTAHRLVNTGSTDLVVGACWPADAGHDYASIARDGFSARVLCRDGRPVLVPEPQS